VALAVLRPILAAPTERLPYFLHETAARSLMGHVDRADASMVVATVVHNADRLSTAPTSLFEGGQCQPMPRAYTLGEHMLTTGLLATPAYAVSRDPILSFNFAVLLSLWIPALTMYALALSATRSAAAAFVAGLAFAMVPGRITDPVHPFVQGDVWAPLALLFLKRLLVAGRLGDAAGLALFTGLTVGESLYALMATGLYLLVFGVVLAGRRPRGLLRALPALTVVGIAMLALTWLVLGPYLETRSTWSVLAGRGSLAVPLGHFAPGREYFPGFVVTALAAIALVDRRRGRRGDDLRLAALVAGLLLVWCAVGALPVPFTDLTLPSPLRMAAGIVPGVDAVRSLYTLGHRVGLAIALLAGYGTLVLVDRRPARRAVAIAAIAAVAILLTRLVDPLARVAFGRALRLAAWDARPDPRDIALVRDSDPGALLHVPLPFVERGFAYDGAHNLLLASYGPRDSADCYNSFPSPVQKQVKLLERDLPGRSAAQALAALGFETLLLRTDWEGAAGFRAALGSADTTLSERASSAARVAYAIGPPGPVSRDFSLLRDDRVGPASNALPPFSVRAPAARIPFSFRNRGSETFRQPDPLVPRDVIVHWSSIGSRDEVHRESRARALLPIALGPGQTIALDVATTVPARPGRYLVSLRRAEAPEEVLARRYVDVAPRPRQGRARPGLPGAARTRYPERAPPTPQPRTGGNP
jgi:hypothetical protein